jgi:ADP-ribosylation factor-binding protein GGA
MGAIPGSANAHADASRIKENIMSAFGSRQVSSPPPPPQPTFSSPSFSQTPSKPLSSPPPAGDPFAALVSASPRAGSPFASTPSSSIHQSQLSSSALLDVGNPSTIQQQSTSNPRNNAGGDEEWTFESSLPEASLPSLPSTNKVRVLSSSLVIDFVSRRNPGHPRQIHVVAVFSNGTSEAISELHFQVAVERVRVNHRFLNLAVPHTNKTRSQSYTLQLRPQSGRDIPGLQQQGVKQEMLLDNVDPGKGNTLKMRFKVSYRVGSKLKEEQGMIAPLGIA